MAQPQIQQLPPGIQIGGPVMVLNQNIQRQTGRSAQLSNIHAASCVSSIIRSTLGPRSMLKMLLSPIGGMAITNDGHCILREVDVSHPAAKSMIELASTQAQIGDGTTTVIVLSGELLILSEPLLTTYSMHPIVIIRGYNKAMMEALEVCEEMARDVSLKKLEGNKVLNELVSTCLNTKFSNRWKNLMVKLALESIQIVKQESVTDNISSQSILKHRHVYNNVHHQVDIKRYVKVEKIPGETIEDSCVLHGIMIQKDLTHSSMRRTIEKPRILLLDCPLEYKKGGFGMER